MKLFTLLYLSLIVNAFSMGSRKPEIKLPELPVPSDTPIREVAGTIEVNGTVIDYETRIIPFHVEFIPVAKYATETEIELIKEASIKVDETVRSGCFKNFMLSARLLETKGRTNLQVWANILGMVDKVPVKIYTKWGSSAIAYRQPPEKAINLNRSFFNSKISPCRWAATMAHEALGHSLGNYGHSYKWSVEREYSVPYKLGGASVKYGGNAFSQCCKD